MRADDLSHDDELGERTPTSYAGLFALPGIPALAASMTLGRIAVSMMSMALTLLALRDYQSASLAGLVNVASIVPGLVMSPVAGALLDRYGRRRLVALDFLAGGLAVLAMGVLAWAHALPPLALLVIAAVASLTTPLSNSGLRTLLPKLVPAHYLERANALDSVSWVISSIVGPPLAGILAGAIGAPLALVLVGVAFLAALVALRGVRDVPDTTLATGSLTRSALVGLHYVLANPSLRGLAVALTLVNVTGGVLAVVLPVTVLARGGSETAVGVLFALQGAGGIVSAAVMGRLDSSGRERRWLAGGIAAWAALIFLMLPDAGLALLAVMMVAIGVATGPLDIALFTIRQRRTDPAQLGRAFSISASLNFAGFPVGAALGGLLAADLGWAVALAAAASVAGAAAAWWMIPARAREWV